MICSQPEDLMNLPHLYLQPSLYLGTNTQDLVLFVNPTSMFFIEPEGPPVFPSVCSSLAFYCCLSCFSFIIFSPIND